MEVGSQKCSGWREPGKVRRDLRGIQAKRSESVWKRFWKNARRVKKTRVALN
jgi:hypothetical protein